MSLSFLIFIIFIPFIASAQPEKMISDCGLHPFENKANSKKDFLPVKIGKHGFILQRVFEEKEQFFVTASHFSNGFPRHLFSVLVKIRLDKSEYQAVKKAFEIHPGSNPEGMFAPFLVLSRLPMEPKKFLKNELGGFCMKDFISILSGHRNDIYGGEENVIYGNLRKWRAVGAVFTPYKLGEGINPVVKINLGKKLNKNEKFERGTYGDVEVIFYHPHKPAIYEFNNKEKAKNYNLRKF